MRPTTLTYKAISLPPQAGLTVRSTQAPQAPPGFKPIHVKPGMPDAVWKRLGDRLPRAPFGEQKQVAEDLIAEFMAGGSSGAAPGSAVRA